MALHCSTSSSSRSEEIRVCVLCVQVDKSQKSPARRVGATLVSLLRLGPSSPNLRSPESSTRVQNPVSAMGV
jgi:hypothetical protein